MTQSACAAQQAGEMTFTEHLEELRNRLFKSLAALLLGLAASYCFIDSIVAFVTAPAGKLYYMRPAEAFFIYLKVGIVSGALLASPLIFYQLWAFIMPAFSMKQRLRLSGLAALSVLLFVAGLSFAYNFVLPLGWVFFTGFGAQNIQSMISMENYIDFILVVLLPFGVIFELPLLLTIGACCGLITSFALKKYRRYVIFISFLVAAILTPPDVVSQVMLALLLLLMYELSIIFIQHVLRR